MAILKDLIVNGAARIIDKLYTKEIIVDSDIKIKNKNDNNYTSLSYTQEKINNGLFNSLQIGTSTDWNRHASIYFVDSPIDKPGSIDTRGLYISAPDDYSSAEFGMKILPCARSIAPLSPSLYDWDTMKLGQNAEGYKWGQIYSTSSVISTSDKNQKTDIENLSDYKDLYMKIFDNINIYRFTKKNTCEETYVEKDHVRKHIGVIAQDFEKFLKDNNISTNDFSGVCSDYFAAYYTKKHVITGGWRTNKVVGEVEYSYSENTYNWKHRGEEGIPEYEVFNEIIEKDVSDMQIDDIRKQIGYIQVVDNSKLTKEQPPVYINSLILVDNDDNYTEVELSNDIIRYYEESDADMSNPLSDAFINDNGQIECHFNKIYSAVLLKTSQSFDITNYKKIIIDIDYISEYKIFFIPECECNNANLWDRLRNDQLLYDYGFRYDEIFNLTTFALQETRKEFDSYKAKTNETINNLVSEIESLKTELNNIKSLLG